MPSRFDDPTWWPAPPPQKAPTGSKLVVGTVVPLIAIGAVVIGITLGRSGSKPKATAAATPATTVQRQLPANASQSDRREAFAECMRSAGVSGRSRLGGRFSRGPSEKFRQAFEVCRSLAPPEVTPTPLQTPRTKLPPPPVA